MKMDPFIEAEEAAGHSVNRCCELFEVSRAAYYQRQKAVPSAREISDVELIGEDHRDPRGVGRHLRLAPGPPRAGRPRHRLWAATGAPADAPGRPGGPLQEALAQDDAPRPRRRDRPGSHPAALRALCRSSIAAMWATSPTSPRGRAGPIWPPSSTWHRAGSSAGRCRPHAHRAGRRGARPWPSPPAAQRAGRHLPFRQGLSIHQRGTTPAWPGPTASCSRSDAQASAGTTR